MACADQADGGGIDTVTITATHSRDTTVINSTSPIQVIDGDELRSTGAGSVAQALQYLVPSFNFPQSESNARIVPTGASLRGLAPDDTLVLVDGKRRTENAVVKNSTGIFHGSMAVDLNVIPTSAIERIEVLTDGASSQYGADAVAGVVNVILKKESKGGGASATYGVYTDKGEQSANLNTWKGVALSGNGFLTLSADTNYADYTDRGQADMRQFYFSGDSREATANRTIGKDGSPRLKNAALLANGGFDVNDVASVYFQANYALADIWANYGVLRPQDNNNVRSIFPDGAGIVQESNNEDIHTLNGVKFDLGGNGTVDVNVRYGRSHEIEYRHNTLNATLGALSPTNLRIATRTNEQTETGVDYTREIPTSFFAKPSTLSSGIVFRHEAYDLEAGETASWINGGATIVGGSSNGLPAPIGPGVRPDEAGSYSRNVYGGYAGLENHLTDDLKLNLSGRSENYDDVGVANSGGVSARYQVVKPVAIRSSFDSGFRAPALGQIGMAGSTSQPQTNGTVLYTRTVPTNSGIAKALGFGDLRPETSKNASVGLVTQPTEKSLITVDAYQISIKDRLAPTDNISGTAVKNILNQYGYSGISVVRVFTNVGDLDTRGIDVAGKTKVDLDKLGSLTLNAGYNVNWNEVTKVNAAPAQLSALGLTLNTDSVTKLLKHGSPRDKLLLGADWHYEEWGMNAQLVRYGRVLAVNLNNVAAQDYWLDPQWVFNLNGSYELSRGLKITLGARNLFDTYPNSVTFGTATYSKYAIQSPDGYNGRQVYLRLDYVF